MWGNSSNRIASVSIGCRYVVAVVKRSAGQRFAPRRNGDVSFRVDSLPSSGPRVAYADSESGIQLEGGEGVLEMQDF